MSIHCAMIIYPYNKPIRSTSFDEYENEHNMSPEEKIQYVKDRIDEETAISPKGPIRYFLYTVGHPDNPDEWTIIDRSDQRRILKKLEEQKYIKNLQSSEDNNTFWLEKVQKRTKKQPTTKQKRRGNILSHIKTTEQLLQNRTLFDKTIQILGEIQANHQYKHSTNEENDDLIQLLIDLELVTYDWNEIEKQTHRQIGNRIIEFEFEANKILPLRERVTGKNGIVRKEALELIAEDIGEHFTLSQIHSAFTDVGVPETMFIDGTKWQVVFYIISYFTTSKEMKDHIIFLKILERVSHPLAFKGDEEEAKKVQERYSKYLKYDRIEIRDNKAYIGPTANEIEVGMDEWISSDGEVVEPKCYTIDPYKVAELWVLWNQLLIIVSAQQINNSLDQKELEDIYLYLIDKSEELIGCGQVGQLNENYVRPFTSLSTAKIEAQIKQVSSPVELVSQFLIEIIALTPDPSLISKKLKENDKLIERVTAATRAISDNGSGKLDIDALSHEQALFILKVVTGHLFQILDVSASGYIGMADEKMNTQYILLMDYFEKTLSRDDFSQLVSNRPDYIPNHLFEAFDEMEIWWSDCNGQASMMSFIGDIETDWIRSGQQTFPMPTWLIEFFNQTGTIASDHRKMKAKKWQQITDNIDEEVKKNGGPFADAQKEEDKVQKHEHVHRFDNSIQEKPIDFNFNQSASNTDKKAGYPHTIPAGTRWEDITLMFVNDEHIKISVAGKVHDTGFADMGFVDSRSDTPNMQWHLLRLLAVKNGSLPASDPEAQNRYKQHKKRLADALKAYFTLDTDPFKRYTMQDGYVLKMTTGYQEKAKSPVQAETVTSEIENLFDEYTAR